jgi:hypothetical protein
MRCGAPAMPLTIAIWILLSVALDGGLRGTQTAPDRAPVGRRWMPMPLFPPGASVVLLLGRCPSPTLNPSFHVRRPNSNASNKHGVGAVDSLVTGHGRHSRAPF